LGTNDPESEKNLDPRRTRPGKSAKKQWKTKQAKLEAAQIRHDLPEDWDSKSRGAKKYWLQSHK